MKVAYSEASRDDVIRQFRYYLVELNLPEIAVRFREAVRGATKAIGERPYAGPSYSVNNAQLRSLRSWPVRGFDARVYFLVEGDKVSVIRILHGKRNVRRILEREKII